MLQSTVKPGATVAEPPPILIVASVTGIVTDCAIEENEKRVKTISNALFIGIVILIKKTVAK
jgi:hypothetical protein